MKVEFDRSFEKSLQKVGDSSILSRIRKIVTRCESAKSLADIPNIKKLTGFRNYYRIRSGEYRIGLELMNANTIRFIIIMHRKDIYRNFPK